MDARRLRLLALAEGGRTPAGERSEGEMLWLQRLLGNPEAGGEDLLLLQPDVSPTEKPMNDVPDIESYPATNEEIRSLLFGPWPEGTPEDIEARFGPLMQRNRRSR